MYIHNWYHSNVSSILLCTWTQVTIYMAHSPCFFLSPCQFPFVSPCFHFNPLLLTWNPPSCDRIRPPRSQVACKLTSPVPTLSPNPPPSKFPEPQLPSATLRQPQEKSCIFYPERYRLFHVHRVPANLLIAKFRAILEWENAKSKNILEQRCSYSLNFFPTNWYLYPRIKNGPSERNYNI